MQICIWDYYGQQKHALMDNMEQTLDDANIQMDQHVCSYFFFSVFSYVYGLQYFE